MQEDLPVNEETFDLLRFLSGYGWWLVIALLLIVVVFIKKTRK
ncbi:hypothetical protein [Salinimicrobium sp. TH3]|nr:hypothetical protein [Salinimicrobium sp. TH3]MCY2686444.1 hypothetical protein [Salinimicrobium sp. TH3]